VAQEVVVPHPLVVMGGSRPGSKILEGLGGADGEKLPTQHTSRQELLYALQPDHNFSLTISPSLLPIQQQPAASSHRRPSAPQHVIQPCGLWASLLLPPSMGAALARLCHIKWPSRAAMLENPYYERTLPSPPTHQSRPASAHAMA